MKRYSVFRKAVLFAFIIGILTVFSFAASGEVIAGGRAVGMNVQLEGLLVTGVEKDSPASLAGLRRGDLLKTVNGTRLESAESLTSAVSDGDPVTLTLSRGETEKTLTVTPEPFEDGFRIGAAVRSELFGIGTLTYYDPDTGGFGALGHGICAETGRDLLPVTVGVIFPTEIQSVMKSVPGTAGQLQGTFKDRMTIGSITKNTDSGVFGYSQPFPGETVPVASEDEVTTGTATLRSNVEGEDVADYEIEIVRKLSVGEQQGKDLLVHVVDASLLEKTGGIVQGMSGSPILQNGKLVGAVTHVLLNAPDYGYAVYAERMLDTQYGAKMAA